MKRETKLVIKQSLNDAVGYTKQAKAAVHYSDYEAFMAYLKGARAALDRAEEQWKH